MTKLRGMAPIPGLVGVALMGTAVLSLARSWNRAAVGAAFASELAHVAAFAVGRGDALVRALMEALLYIGAGVTAVKMIRLHQGLQPAREALSKFDVGAKSDRQRQAQEAGITRLIDRARAREHRSYFRFLADGSP